MRPFGNLVKQVQTTPPHALASSLATVLASRGVRDAVLSLVDYEQEALHPLRDDNAEDGEEVGVEAVVGSMAGRCFLTQTLVDAQRADGCRVWIPVTERAERLGVLACTVENLDDQTREFCVELGLVLAQHVVAAGQYTDAYYLTRRRRGMDLAAEMQWELLPPLGFRSEIVAVAGQLEPAYDVGGDAFDYAMNGPVVEIAIFDAMGHNLGSSLLSTLAVGSYRHHRRNGRSLEETAAAIDEVVSAQIPEAFVTAVLGRLDCRTGVFRWVNAGHPRPLALRGTHVFDDLVCEPTLPLGMGVHAPQLCETRLEPGDRLLLYTDGMVEARSLEGEAFGEGRLRDMLEREAATGASASELVRRVVQAVMHHRAGDLVDDATALLVEWPGPFDDTSFAS